MKVAIKKGKTVGFRPMPRVQERLEYAEKIGVNTAQMLNDLVEKFGQKYLEEARKGIQAALQTPVP